jgi:hypothetical protein
VVSSRVPHSKTDNGVGLTLTQLRVKTSNTIVDKGCPHCLHAQGIEYFEDGEAWKADTQRGTGTARAKPNYTHVLCSVVGERRKPSSWSSAQPPSLKYFNPREDYPVNSGKCRG